MGQAKKRGDYEQRKQQSQTATDERQISARLLREQKQAEADAAWELLSDEDKAIIRAKRLEREKVRRSITGMLGMTSLLLSAGNHDLRR